MSLEYEKFKEEFEQYKKNIDKRIHHVEVNQKAIYEGVVAIRNKLTSMISPIELKLKKHLQLHEFWYNFVKYLLVIVTGAIALYSSVTGFFRDIFK